MRSACSSPTSADGPALILASGSPQRRAILEQLGVRFEVVVPDVDELTEGPAVEVVLENAHRKAAAVARAPGAAATAGTGAGGGMVAPVLGVDTVVALGGEVFGKPRDAAHAAALLARLAGRDHTVHSGVCVIDAQRTRTAAARTEVRFRALGPEQIDAYVATGEWRGRAGGYAIQGIGAALVEAITGDYLNVVGLPVATLLDLMPRLVLG